MAQKNNVLDALTVIHEFLEGSTTEADQALSDADEGEPTTISEAKERFNEYCDAIIGDVARMKQRANSMAFSKFLKEELK